MYGPVGRPPNRPIIWYHDFLYQAAFDFGRYEYWLVTGVERTPGLTARRPSGCQACCSAIRQARIVVTVHCAAATDSHEGYPVNSRERLITVLQGGQPDRVPVTVYEYSPLGDGWPADEPSYAPVLELERRYGDSFLWVSLERPVFFGDVQSVREMEERGVDGTVTRTTEIDTPKGPLRGISRRNPGLMTSWQVEPLVKTDDDIDRVLSVETPPPEANAARVAECEARLGDRGILCFNIGDAIGHVVGLFRFEDFVLRCHRDDGPIRALLARAQAILLRVVRTLGAVVNHAAFRLWGPEYCGAPLMNPGVYFRRYVVEQDRELTQALHQTNNFSVVHCHGRLRSILDMIAETQADALEPLKTLPMVTADITLAEIKRRVGDRMSLIGAVQALTLETGSQNDVQRMVRQAIDEGAAGGRFVLLPTAAPFMVPLTPRCLANVEAMYRAAHAFGRYK